MLFLELALIRWLGSNIIYLSFFSNLVLLGSFLGIGLGFLSGERSIEFMRWFPRSLLGLVGFVLVFPVKIDRIGGELIFFGEFTPSGLPIWLTIPVIFLFVVGIMTMLAQGVARAFAQFPPLVAYRLDICGSLAGVVAFATLSYLRTGPVVWAAVVAGLVIWLSTDLRGPDYLALAGLVLVLGAQTIAPNLSWSPYYQVATADLEDGVSIEVNGIPHQAIRPIRDLRETLYVEPYRLHGPAPLDRVLIIGAGSGNDVAVALAHGAGEVDAVEIDPRLHEIGVEMHPDQPYADPRVTVEIDDGRAFMQRAQTGYDLIVFALPDSLTLVSGQSGLRLESFLFTTEAFTQARELLNPNGTFALYNFYRENWLIERLARTISVAFGSSPCVLSIGDVGRQALLAVGPGPSANCPNPPMDLSGAPAPASDDYPFLYLRERGIPRLYGLTLALIVLLSLGAIRLTVGGLGRLLPYFDLFAMGVAFLLLETKSVVQYALWFGTTWIVNAMVFAGVLLSVLAAVEMARRVRLPKPAFLYVTLFCALGVAFAVPTDALLELSIPLRLIAGTLLTMTPIFLANLIFAQRFARTASSTAAFGANLLGAMFGGVLEYSSLLVGYRALIVIVALVYGAAFLLGRTRLTLAN